MVSVEWGPREIFLVSVETRRRKNFYNRKVLTKNVNSHIHNQ